VGRLEGLLAVQSGGFGGWGGGEAGEAAGDQC